MKGVQIPDVNGRNPIQDVPTRENENMCERTANRGIVQVASELGFIAVKLAKHWKDRDYVPPDISRIENLISKLQYLEELAASSTSKSTDNSASVEDVPDFVSAEIVSSPLSIKESEKRVIIDALEKANWVQTVAARKLGISPRVLNYKISKFKIKHASWVTNC
jgi:transcriptional regulator with GAF, ATPase, and Fis domain